MCGGQGPPPPLDPWPGQNTTAPRALYSKELRLLAHVLATARAGDPASVCKAIEDFGEEVLGSSGLWLNFKTAAGGSKAEVLSAAVCRAPSHGKPTKNGVVPG